KTAEPMELTRNAVHEMVLATYQKCYEELAINWGSIDGKAQGTVTIAGIFVAGIFGFVKSLSDHRASVKPGSAILSVCLISEKLCVRNTTLENSLLGLSVCALFASVLLGVFALRLRGSPAPFFP